MTIEFTLYRVVTKFGFTGGSGKEVDWEGETQKLGFFDIFIIVGLTSCRFYLKIQKP